MAYIVKAAGGDQFTPVRNGDTVSVQNSAGTAVPGTHLIQASGATQLAATIAPIANGDTSTVTPTGTFTTTVTFTVANGVITGIALS